MGRAIERLLRTDPSESGDPHAASNRTITNPSTIHPTRHAAQIGRAPQFRMPEILPAGGDGDACLFIVRPFPAHILWLPNDPDRSSDDGEHDGVRSVNRIFQAVRWRGM